MIDIILNSFKENSDKLAFVTDSESITFGELLDLSKRYAFSISGSKKPVIVKGKKQIHMLAGFVACLMASRPYVPCDEDMPEIRFRSLVEASGADTVIDSDFVPAEERLEHFENNDGDIAYIIFTSGSTGVPKGVPISRGNLKAFVHGLLGRLPALCEQKGKVVLNQARFSFDLSVADIYFSLCFGSTLFALGNKIQLEPEKMLDAFSKSGASLAVMTPTFAKYCLCMPEFGRELLPNLRCIFFCGETLEPQTAKKLMKRFDGLKIINAYGPTEATCAVCGIEITGEMCESAVLPVGKTDLATCNISVCDGEIVLDGKSVFGGYLGKEPLDGAYKTGDKGEIIDGTVYCYGRKYGYVKYKGHRIELDEIKNAMLRIEGVEQCEVIAVTGKNNVITAITAKAVSFTLNEDEIKSHLSQLIPEYMMPRTIKILDRISFNDNGKQRLE